jgi:hypothetical protein
LFFVPASFSLIHGWLESRRKTENRASLTEAFDEFDQLSE